MEGNRILRPAPPVVSTAGHRRLEGTLVPGASRLHTRRTHMSMNERVIPRLTRHFAEESRCLRNIYAGQGLLMSPDLHRHQH